MNVSLTRNLKCVFIITSIYSFYKEFPYFKTLIFFFKQKLCKDSILFPHLSSYYHLSSLINRVRPMGSVPFNGGLAQSVELDLWFSTTPAHSVISCEKNGCVPHLVGLRCESRSQGCCYSFLISLSELTKLQLSMTSLIKLYSTTKDLLHGSGTDWYR